MPVDTSEFRRRALAALKGRWQTALLVGFIAMLPSIFSTVFASLTNGSFADLLILLNEQAASGALMTADDVTKAAQSWAANGGTAAAAVSLVCTLVAPVLTLCLYGWLTDRQRGSEPAVKDMFSRLRLGLRAILLNLAVILKVALWLLPGMAALLGVETLILTGGEDSLSMFLSVVPILSVLAMIPALLAVLRYAMAFPALADRTHYRVRDAIRASKAVMKGRKGLLVASVFIAYALMFAVQLAGNLLASVFGTVLASTASMLASLALQVLLAAIETAFWLRFAYLADEPAAAKSGDTPPAAEA